MTKPINSYPSGTSAGPPTTPLVSIRKPEIYYPKPWPRTDRQIPDVVILGAGQTGLAIWRQLRLASIDNILLLDAAEPGLQGGWQTIARMRSLRTKKTIGGPEIGDHSLSFQHWIDNEMGPGAFDALDRIPRPQWQTYLDWFAQQTGASPQWRTRLTGVTGDRNGLTLQLETSTGTTVQRTRHLVVATGIDGFGGAYIPKEVRAIVPADRLWHSNDAIPAKVFSRARLLVVGGSASAFDVAATALEAGAVEVVQITRNPELAISIEAGPDQRDVLGELRVFHLMSPEARWRAILRQRARGTVPPWAVDRARAQPGHYLYQGVSAGRLRINGTDIELSVEETVHRFDHVICATGYRQGASLRAEFASLAPLIRTWGDLGLAASQEQEHWRALPLLGSGFELVPKDPDYDWLSRIHVLTFAAILSHGIHAGDIGSASIAVPRLVGYLCERLFHHAKAHHERNAFDPSFEPRFQQVEETQQ